LEANEIVANIIEVYAELPEGRVFLANQNITMPKDGDIFVIVSTESVKRIAINVNYDVEESQEKITSVIQTKLNVNIYSRNDEAELQKEIIAQSIYSYFALSIAEKENVRIYRQGDILDLSFLDGSGILKRFQFSIIVNSKKSKVTDIDVYDKFQTEVTNE
jgi:hypothetical protein